MEMFGSENKENKMSKKELISILPVMQEQISSLFGYHSKDAQRYDFSQAELVKLLNKILNELKYYLDKNIDTDSLHYNQLTDSLSLLSNSSYKDKRMEEIYFDYIEKFIRFSLLLMGDNPDHRKRKGGRKSKEHYDLSRHRSIIYLQDTDQQFFTMLNASIYFREKFKIDTKKVLRDFRHEKGYKATRKDFINWFKEKYPKEYLVLF